jgi:pimeloyl-ACP methyl ester carboxylesterase
MWAPLVPSLAGQRRVLVPDLRGFGRSSAPPGGYDKHTLARDILELADSEGIDRFAVVGHDWGGWIAWLLALEHPDRVTRFAALDVPPPRGLDLSPLRLPAQALFSTYQLVIASPVAGERLVRSERLIRAFIRASAARPIPAGALDRYASAVTPPERARASVALYRTFLMRELPALARRAYSNGELRVPGLALMGERSAITRLMGAPSPSPMLQVQTIAGAGHFLVDEAPDEVRDRLLAFLELAA